MGERKVLVNYISPDFDPSIIPKFKRSKERIQEIRMMLPFSMQCNTCGEYLYRGKKFNSRKEDCKGEDYMGIRRFRFYIKCSVCSAEITFKTDPKNTDYECESGASRNFEVWRDTEQAEEEVKREREEEDEYDTMKALENRTLDSKIEMDVLDALDEIKAINQRHERVDTNKVLAALQKNGSKAGMATAGADTVDPVTGLSAADEDLIKSIKFKSVADPDPGSASGAQQVVAEGEVHQSLRQEGGAEEEGVSTLRDSSTSFSSNSNSSATNSAATAILKQQQLLQQAKAASASVEPSNKPVITLKKRKLEESAPTTGSTRAAQAPVPVPATKAITGMFDYSDDE
jgi:hypothetical protein